MKKSKNISKYDLEWQVIRAKIKGSKVSLEDKIKSARRYYKATRTMDRWERVVNWLEGLERGYRGRNQENVERIRIEIDAFKHVKDSVKSVLPLDVEKQEILLQKVSISDLKVLWKDLFIRNKKWLQGGYVNKELNDFMNWIWNSRLKHNKEEISSTFSFDKLSDYRKKAKNKKVTHKFFF